MVVHMSTYREDWTRMTAPHRQCAKCPWKKNVNPHTIPDGYSVEKHRALARTIAIPGELRTGPLRIFACHESRGGRELACVGWLAHQLGPGNNLALRLAVMHGRIDGDIQTVGPQHERFEDTLP